MRKSAESGFAVVAPKAAFTDTTERKIAVGDVHDGIVDATTAKRQFAQDLLLNLPASRKQI